MCCSEKNGGCECPEKLRGNKPEDCTPKQIQECHGTKEEHPCAPKEKQKK